MSELITRALLRIVDLPGRDAGRAALVTLDNGRDHTKPNTLGPAGLASLDEAIDAALAARPVFVAVTGKPYIFCVGADVTGIPAVRSREDGLAIGRLGHRVFARLRDSEVPTFAFINGAAMGGGLELALHCHYRTLSGGAGAIALPEVSLGLVPAWGGTQLLPNLIGIVPAAQVIVQNPLMQNRMLKPAQAREMGLADVLFDPADFLERSLDWAAAVVRGDVVVARPEVDRSDMWDAVIGFARDQLDERLHGAAPAPYRALDLLALARTASFVDGTAAENEALADLLLTNELRNGLYAFDLVQRRAKRPVGAPDPSRAREITKVGIVGAGLMASQLALLFARRLGVPVVLTDLDAERVAAGVSYVDKEVERQVGKGRLDTGTAAKIRALVSGSVDKVVFADADLVVEAVFEDLAVKKQVWADVEKIVRPDCILATNTSSLSVTEMSADLAHPQRVVGLHFFNPVALMPLLEIVRTERTDDATLATAFAVGRQLRKSCVLVKDAPAFVVNRLLGRLLGEVMSAIDAGTPLDVADRALDPLGLPMRPSELLELVGPPVAHHVAGILHAAFPDRFRVSENLGRLVAAGTSSAAGTRVRDGNAAGTRVRDGNAAGTRVRDGNAAGTRVRDGNAAGPTDLADPSVAAPLETGDQPLSTEELRDRTLAALAEEIRLMLDEGVVAEAQDIDLCLILGAGWPFHLGGITPYLKQTGRLQPDQLQPDQL